jgi:WD40 repeat protein
MEPVKPDTRKSTLSPFRACALLLGACGIITAISLAVPYFQCKYLSNAVRIYDLATGQSRHVLIGHTDEVAGMAFSPDGKMLATISPYHSYQPTVRLWDPATGRSLSLLSLRKFSSSWVCSLAFSPDGRTLAISGCSEVEFIEVASGQNLLTLRGEPIVQGATYMVFSPDGKTLAMADRACHNIQFWDPATGQRLRTLTLTYDEGYYRGNVAFSPDGKLLAFSTCTERGNYYDCLKSEILFWDLSTGQLSRRWTTCEGNACPPTGWEAAFSPDWKMLVTYSNSGPVSVYDLASGQILQTITVSFGRLPIVVFSPDGKTLAIGHEEGVQLWDPATGQLIRDFDAVWGEIVGVVFSPDGKWLAARYQTKTFSLVGLFPP